MKFILIFCLLINSFQSFSQNSTIPKSLCDYENFIHGGIDDKENNLRKDLYLKMLGALVELNDYKKDFFRDGRLINLFPTLYYNVSLVEMQNIATDNIYKYPVEKLFEMLAFYEAYRFNRDNWNRNNISKVERHWLKHFQSAKDFNNVIDRVNELKNISNRTQNEEDELQNRYIQLEVQIGVMLKPTLCGIPTTSAPCAHIVYDLPRAIRYTFLNRFNKNISAQALEIDFNRTDAIFDKAFDYSFTDLENTYGTAFISNMKWIKSVIVSRIKSMRKDAWKIGIGNQKIDVLIQQPFDIIYLSNSLLKKGENLCPSSNSSTLLLFDVSGSMNENNKWQNAKQSALSTLASIKSQAKAANLKPTISIRAFEGDCATDPTKEVIGFTTNLPTVEDAIKNKVPPPGGGTPLPQSIQVSEDKLKAYLSANNIKKGKLIILTDGESTCGSLRPQGVYSNGQPGLQPVAKFNPNGSAALIRYYAIGFEIAPGSEAERDLQYLVQTNGGKYLNAQNQIELTDALYKFNRVYTPKPSPAITPATEKEQTLFSDGLTFIDEEVYDKALENYTQYVKANEKDFNGIYNLALMSEANERYKSAIKNYELYLLLNPNAPDKGFILETIQKLKETAKRYAAYNKLVVKSDMEYLDLYFKKIQNGESVALAVEFIGFLKEKYTYYRDLAAIVEVDDRLFKVNANEVFKGLKECVETISRNPQAWDRDATPVLSRTYLNMERLLSSF